MVLQIVVGSTTLLAWASSYLIDFRPESRPSIQPRSMAFAIWIVIFPLILFSSFFASTPRFPNNSSILISSSMITTILWAFASRYKYYTVAFILLVLISGQAWIAHILLPVSNDVFDIMIHFGTGLFAGWTGIASIINLAIAYQYFNNSRTLFLVNIMGILSLYFQRPVPMMAILWGLVFSDTENIYVVSNIILSCIWLLASFLWCGSL